MEDRKRIDNPIARFRLFLESQGWWNAEAEEELRARLKADVMKAFKRAETIPRPELGELFTDVYGGEEPWNIVRLFCLRYFIFCLTQLFESPERAAPRADRFVAEVRGGL